MLEKFWRKSLQCCGPLAKENLFKDSLEILSKKKKSSRDLSWCATGFLKVLHWQYHPGSLIPPCIHSGISAEIHWTFLQGLTRFFFLNFVRNLSFSFMAFIWFFFPGTTIIPKIFLQVSLGMLFKICLEYVQEFLSREAD